MRIRIEKHKRSFLLTIQKEIEQYGESSKCPRWTGVVLNYDHRKWPKSCHFCHQLFPRVKKYTTRTNETAFVGCPCDFYTPKYLCRMISRLLNGKVEM